MRIAAPIAVAAVSLATAVHAQDGQRPPAAGPFLHAQQDESTLVLLSMAERRTTAVGASTTSVTFVSHGDALFRAEAVVEADCTRRVRRSGEIFVHLAENPDVRGDPITSVPAIDWSPLGPLDGPLMDYLCEDGRHDPARVSDRPSTFVTPWLQGL